MSLSTELLEEIKSALIGKQDCADFLVAYGRYVELYDDYVDQDKAPVTIHDIHTAATSMYSLPYWRANAHRLFALEGAIHHIYKTSVLWEQDNKPEWQRIHAKALSHIGYAMLIGILYLENPEAIKVIAPKIMEECHKAHLGDVV